MILERLNKYINNETKPDYSDYKLDNIKNLLKIFNNPEKKLTSIHIAGTNGKGSTAAIISAILINCGYKTALFTSPHLLVLNERISVNNILISDTEFIDILNLIEEKISHKNTTTPTFFDILTLIAILFFQKNSIDIAIFETGIGGKLDSTNIINPELSIITDISLDHENILGDNLESITIEKAGIIKSSTPIITANSNNEILSILEDVSKKRKAKLLRLGENFSISKIEFNNNRYKFNYQMNDNVINNIELPLLSFHQVKNSSIAITALLLLKNKFPLISEKIIKETLTTITLKGRFEKISENPICYFDPAHNIAAIKNLYKTFGAIYPDKEIITITSLMKDKNIEEILKHIKHKSNKIIYYNIDDPRSFTPISSREKRWFFKIIDNTTELKRFLFKEEFIDENIFLFTGSFRLYKISIDVTTKTKDENF